MSQELYGKANEAFVNENYHLAVELYTKAIELDSTNPDYYANRGNCYLKLEKYEEARIDTTKALELGINKPLLFMRNGRACFHLRSYQEAKEAFLQGKQLSGEAVIDFDNWLQRCEAKLQELKEKEAKRVIQQPAKVRYDWYQTEIDVLVTVLVKNAKPTEVSTQFDRNSLVCKVSGNEIREDFELDVKLAHEIRHELSATRIFSSKVEIRLRKAEGIRWKTLQENTTTEKVQEMMNCVDLAAKEEHKNYPTSSTNKKNWDKLVTEIKEEEKKDVDSANDVFKILYDQSSEDARRAMMKSYSESGGTVLSMNWDDVKKKKVDMKPPEGIEWKKW